PTLVGLPSPSMPVELTFKPEPAAVITIVWDLGTGPGSYFDFAGLSFHVPTAGSVWADRATAPRTTTKAENTRLIRHLLSERVCGRRHCTAVRWGRFESLSRAGHSTRNTTSSPACWSSRTRTCRRCC